MGKFLAIVKSSINSSQFDLICFHFNDNSNEFTNSILFELNRRVGKIECSHNHSEFVFSIEKPPALFWSRGSKQFDLEPNEKVNSITEWKAKLGENNVRLWVVCTTRYQEGRLLFFSQSRSDNNVRLVLPKTFQSPIVAFTAVSSRLAFFVQDDIITGLSLETGALTQRAKANSKIPNVVAIDSSINYIAVLSDKDGFSIFTVINDTKIESLAVVRVHDLYGRIKVMNNFVIVTSRLEPIAYIYNICQNPIIMRTVNVLSPIVSIFSVNGKALFNCICGEIYIVNCNGDEIVDSDLSGLFSFGNSSFALE
ncbi:hypothetical protein GPJ56_009181 [Histomonas meleagridis]|uniref:uncharacterized protein n=1 Tax=Histomonas meleagridis TaxID=135588 RepID=UPI003559FDC4|nr:hypothetical protein GPJ56_009181 [Histomonas meleagridis]KAH0799065.1 hypothetical protein GO595_007862 [Histomonas meleagridis]